MIIPSLKKKSCNGLSLFYFSSGVSDSSGDNCTLSPLVMPSQDLVAVCCQRVPSGMSPVPSSVIVTSCVDSVRGGCRGNIIFRFVELSQISSFPIFSFYSNHWHHGHGKRSFFQILLIKSIHSNTQETCFIILSCSYIICK